VPSPAAAGGGAAAPGGGRPAVYAFSAPLSPAHTLSWSVAGGRLWLRLASAARGWAGVAINDGPGMVSGDAIIVGPANSPPVAAWTLGGKDAGAFGPAGGVLDASTGTFAATPAGGWVAEFSRPMAAGAYAGARAVPAGGGGGGVLTAAWGDAPDVGPHGSEASYTGAFNAVTGSLVARSNRPVLVAHAVVMAAAWAVLSPAAVAFARFGKGLEPRAGPAARWFVLHKGLNYAAWAASLVGAGLGVGYVAAGSLRAAHFASAHARLGLVVVLLGFLQPLNACVRPPKLAPGALAPSPARVAWEAAHKTQGYLTLALGVAAVFTGIALAGFPLTGAFAAWVALAAAAAAAAEARARSFARRRPAKAAIYGAVAPPAAPPAAAGGKHGGAADDGDGAVVTTAGPASYAVRFAVPPAPVAAPAFVAAPAPVAVPAPVTAPASVAAPVPVEAPVAITPEPVTTSVAAVHEPAAALAPAAAPEPAAAAPEPAAAAPEPAAAAAPQPAAVTYVTDAVALPDGTLPPGWTRYQDAADVWFVHADGRTSWVAPSA